MIRRFFDVASVLYGVILLVIALCLAASYTHLNDE